MKVSIYEEKAVVEPEPEFKLKLFMIGWSVHVALADEKGDRIGSTSLVSFDKDMRIFRCCNISPLPGLPLDDLSRLLEKGAR